MVRCDHDCRVSRQALYHCIVFIYYRVAAARDDRRVLVNHCDVLKHTVGNVMHRDRERDLIAKFVIGCYFFCLLLGRIDRIAGDLQLSVYNHKLDICKVLVRVLEVFIYDANVVSAYQRALRRPGVSCGLFYRGSYIVQLVVCNYALVTIDALFGSVIFVAGTVLRHRYRYRITVGCNLQLAFILCNRVVVSLEVRSLSVGDRVRYFALRYRRYTACRFDVADFLLEDCRTFATYRYVRFL